ncbi:hypothetical protein, partial [Chryseobacterium sp. 18068]|uniref:hypothetical protein n=1 Tax=Chryseobacterium sp. 18068 TaxID=2681414 RepID=UPI00135CF3F7
MKTKSSIEDLVFNYERHFRQHRTALGKRSGYTHRTTSLDVPMGKYNYITHIIAYYGDELHHQISGICS